MTANRKRRWMLAIVAAGVLAGVVASFALREDPKDDVPRLVILRQEQANGQNMVVFRFDAPKHSTVLLTAMGTLNPFTGEKRRPVAVWHDGIRHDIRGDAHSAGFNVFPPVQVEAGRSREFFVLRPPDDVWRLRCQVGLTSASRMRVVLTRVKDCWQTKSFTPLRGIVVHSIETLESDFITNAVPSTTETPAR